MFNVGCLTWIISIVCGIYIRITLNEILHCAIIYHQEELYRSNVHHSIQTQWIISQWLIDRIRDFVHDKLLYECLRKNYLSRWLQQSTCRLLFVPQGRYPWKLYFSLSHVAHRFIVYTLRASLHSQGMTWMHRSWNHPLFSCINLK